MDDELIDAATAARERAYAPYSEFRMGAAVRTDAGDIVTGTLVENVSLGLAMCAERVAMFATVAAGATPRSLVLVSPRTGDDVTRPCGACLQVGLELGGPAMTVTAVSTDGERESTTIGALLPQGPKKA